MSRLFNAIEQKSSIDNDDENDTLKATREMAIFVVGHFLDQLDDGWPIVPAN